MCTKSDAPKPGTAATSTSCSCKCNRKDFGWLRSRVAFVALVLLGCSVWALWWSRPTGNCWRGILVLWTMGPPLWFCLENSLFNWGFLPATDPEKFSREQDLARNVWAAVAALLVGLYGLTSPESKTLTCRGISSVTEAMMAACPAQNRDIHWYLNFNFDRGSASSTQHLSCVEAGR